MAIRWDADEPIQLVVEHGRIACDHTVNGHTMSCVAIAITGIIGVVFLVCIMLLLRDRSIRVGEHTQRYVYLRVNDVSGTVRPFVNRHHMTVTNTNAAVAAAGAIAIGTCAIAIGRGM